MTLNYPTRFNEIARWAEQERSPVPDATRKYVQYLILKAISDSRSLRNSMVFKGGNALEFFHLPNRATVDLDFSFVEPVANNQMHLESVQRQLVSAINPYTDGFGTILRVQGVRQNPRGQHVARATLRANVAYALHDQSNQLARLESGQPGANIVPVEITSNEVVCAWEEADLGDDKNSLLVATIEDIVAEKLRAILQQSVRNRHRRQDILDVASLWRQSDNSMRTNLISDFLVRKGEARDITATKSRFHDPEIRQRSATNYTDLEATTRYTFIPFDEAWESVMDLVNQLDIPD